MLASLTPIVVGQPFPRMWEIGQAHGVPRAGLREHLGEPLYVETDSSSTFGGDEDWWAYRTRDGDVVSVCFRVPYEDAILYVSDPSERSVRDVAMALVTPWACELFEPRPF